MTKKAAPEYDIGIEDIFGILPGVPTVKEKSK